MNQKLILEETAKRYGGKTAIIMDEHRLSYAELDEASNKVANALIKMGVVKGDRIAMLLPNVPEFAIIYFGVVKAGGITVPLNPGYKVDELISLFDDFQPKVLVAPSSILESLIPILPKFSSIKHIIDLDSKYEGQFVSYREIMATSPSQRVELELEPEDITNITYTSGTTGRPKGVTLSERVFMMAPQAVGFQQTDKDVVMLYAMPLYHIYSLIAVLLLSVARGSTIVIVPGLSITSLMEAIEREKGTMLITIPPVYTQAISLAEKEGIRYDLTSLRLCNSAGALLPVDIIKRFKQLYGLDINQVYATTETPFFNTLQPLDGTGKLGSVGKVQPGCELKIVDDDSRELPPNQEGEIIIRGPVMKGYYGNPQATAEVIKDGWFYTGDVGRIDEDGYVFISGRKKDMIIISGQNVYPVDVEDVLHTHPKIAEAAVVGIPDQRRGEAIRVIISLKKGEIATEGEIRRFCREHLADFKVPKQIIFMDSLPRTSTGKVLKKDLRGKR